MKIFLPVIISWVLLLHAASPGLLDAGGLRKRHVELTFWHSMSIYQGDTLEVLIEEYNRLNKDLKVKLVFQGLYDDMKTKLMSEIERAFRPEFLNRLDEIVVFKNLTKEDIRQVVDIEMKSIRERMVDRGMKIDLDEQAKELLITQGYDPEYGARPMKRCIQRLIEDPLSEEILRGTLPDHSHIKVTVKDDHLYFDSETIPQEWWDLMVGLKTKFVLSKTVLLSIGGDVGGFGLGNSSKFAWDFSYSNSFKVSSSTYLASA